MTGSTLYRRLPNGSWASEREDPPGSAEAPSGDSRAAAGAPVVVGAAAVGGAAASAALPVAGAAQPVASAQPAPVASPPPQAAPPAASPRRGRWRTVRRVLLGAAIAYAAWLVFLMIYSAFALEEVDALSPDPIAQTDGSVWLLVGSDSRDGLTRKERRRLRTGDEEGQRTDTIMLVHQAIGSAPTLISIPRDSWVTIPAHSASDGTQAAARSGKINSAYAFGGAPLLSQTIEYNTGLHVDHYMEVGMGGIVSMTDAVGGVEVCFDNPIQDRNSGLDVQAGCQNLDGDQALAWVRMRYADPKGDLGRIERQRQYMALMVDQLLSVQTLVNPFRQWQIVNASLDSVKVDPDTGLVDLGMFGVGMGRLAAGGGEVITVPIDDTDKWEAGQSVIKWDSAESDELFASLGGAPPQAAAE